MKKKILGGLAFLAIATTAAWNMNVNTQTKWMSDVMLANVEALAQEVDTFTGCPTGCLLNGDGCYCYQWYEREKFP